MELELRALNAPDIFLVSKIISKIGVNEFRQCFSSDDIKKLITNSGKGNEAVVGIGVALEVGNIILTNLPKCEDDIYSFLASVSNTDVKTIKSLGMVEFFELIVEIIKKPEFKDFIKVVSKLFKSEK